jgi:hypothetical protein
MARAADFSGVIDVPLGSGEDEPPFLPTPVISEESSSARRIKRDEHRRGKRPS